MKNTDKNFTVSLSTHFVVVFAGVILFSLLGTGIARYLGNRIDLTALSSGLLITVFFTASGVFLQVFFDPKRLKRANQTEDGLKNNNQSLVMGLSSLAIGIFFAFFHFVTTGINIPAVLFMSIFFILILLYAVPPVALITRGYGELVLILIMAVLSPAMAFTLQTGTMHNLVLLITIPLSCFLFAMFLSTELYGFLEAMTNGEKPLVIMLGWKLSMDLHDWLILAGYVLLSIEILLGLPWNLLWPTLLSIPLFGFTIYEIHRMKNGAKPRWQLLTFTGYAGIGLMLYALLFTLWVG